VAIVLAYRDGGRYIGEQLASVFAQTHRGLRVYLFDDASEIPFDADALGLAPADRDRLTVRRRPKRLGFVRNFLSGLAEVGGGHDFYFFCDQDDIWAPDKVKRALKFLLPHDGPALYCGRTEIVDASGRRARGLSPLFARPPSFANALVQNVGGGNTMALNRAARELVVGAGGRDAGCAPVSHDWWCYQLVSGAGGRVHYDPEPRLWYRQHGQNLVGANSGARARMARLGALLAGRFVEWNDCNLAALGAAEHLLTDQARASLRDFREARRSGLAFQRLYLARRAGLHRQTAAGNLGLLLGLLLGRV
jgi:glycosyltransferase involved in cell wall biosynthesis